jgi:dsRNA-specific ribonuclease
MDLLTVQEQFGYIFIDGELCHRALMADRVLEQLGDKFLDWCVLQFLYDQFPKLSVGALIWIKQQYICNRTLAQIAKEIGLAAILDWRSHKQLANVMEALIGAMSQEQPLAEVETVILKLLLAQHDPKKLYREALTQYGRNKLRLPPKRARCRVPAVEQFSEIYSTISS